MGAEDSLSGFGNSCNGSLFNPATSEPSSYSAGAALVALVAYPAYLLHVSLNLQKQVLLYVVRLILVRTVIITLVTSDVYLLPHLRLHCTVYHTAAWALRCCCVE